MSPALISAFGALLNIAGSGVYVVHTLQGRNKPNRMTFFMWTIIPAISVAASFVQGVTWALVPVIFAGLMPLTIFIASFVNPHAYWKLGRLDYLCGAVSVFALVLWWLTDEPNLAILFAIIADAMAGYPTLLKAWQHPDTESWQGYVGAAMSAALAFAVIESWSFAALAFPVYMIVMNTSLTVGILRGKVIARVI